MFLLILSGCDFGAPVGGTGSLPNPLGDDWLIMFCLLQSPCFVTIYSQTLNATMIRVWRLDSCSTTTTAASVGCIPILLSFFPFMFAGARAVSSLKLPGPLRNSYAACARLLSWTRHETLQDLTKKIQLLIDGFFTTNIRRKCDRPVSCRSTGTVSARSNNPFQNHPAMLLSLPNSASGQGSIVLPFSPRHGLTLKWTNRAQLSLAVFGLEHKQNTDPYGSHGKLKGSSRRVCTMLRYTHALL